MILNKPLSIFLSAAFLFSGAHAWAFGSPEDQGEDIFTLGEVVVSAPLSGIESAETVHEITAEDLKKSNARTLDEALVLLSDVNVRVGNEGVPRIDIRGFRTRHVLLLVDGIPMNSAFDQQFDPSTIPVENIAKIKVTAGASSVLYGQGGLGGVINIITKKGRKGLSGMVGYEAGDGTPYLAKGSLSGGKGKFDFFLSASGYDRDRFPLAKSFTATPEEGAGYRKNSDSTKRNVFLNVGFNPNSDLYLALTANYVQGGYGKPASAIDNTFDPYSPAPKYGRVDDYTGITLQLAADYSATKDLNIRSMIYYNRMDQDNNQYDNENYNSFDDPDVPGSMKIRNKGTGRGASIQPKYDLGRAGIVTLGFSGEWDTWEDSGLWKYGGQMGGVGSKPFLLHPTNNHKDLFICSTALEYEVPISKNVGFAAGYAYHWQFRDEKNLEDYSISASLSYDPFKNTRLKAAFQRNIRFPSLSQLYLKDTDNDQLTTERVYHYQLGMEQKLPWRSLLKLSLFKSDAHNFIAVNQNLPRPKNTNFSLYRFYGFETSLETNFLPRLLLKASYTRNESEDRSGVGRDEVQYVPRDKIAVYGKYDFNFGLTPFFSVVYVANSYVYTKQQIATVGKAQMANYIVVNTKLSQKLLNDKVIVYFGVDNLFNKDYEDSYGIPRPGRYIYGGFEYRFGK
ncbi:MAG: TonB-dependent receptor [Geobacteraceae bacterium]|nr:TonB-dependent receptor [Geobacteraceae bacterium]